MVLQDIIKKLNSNNKKEKESALAHLAKKLKVNSGASAIEQEVDELYEDDIKKSKAFYLLGKAVEEFTESKVANETIAAQQSWEIVSLFESSNSFLQKALSLGNDRASLRDDIQKTEYRWRSWEFTAFMDTRIAGKKPKEEVYDQAYEIVSDPVFDKAGEYDTQAYMEYNVEKTKEIADFFKEVNEFEKARSLYEKILKWDEDYGKNKEEYLLAEDNLSMIQKSLKAMSADHGRDEVNEESTSKENSKIESLVKSPNLFLQKASSLDSDIESLHDNVEDNHDDDSDYEEISIEEEWDGEEVSDGEEEWNDEEEFAAEHSAKNFNSQAKSKKRKISVFEGDVKDDESTISASKRIKLKESNIKPNKAFLEILSQLTWYYSPHGKHYCTSISDVTEGESYLEQFNEELKKVSPRVKNKAQYEVEQQIFYVDGYFLKRILAYADLPWPKVFAPDEFIEEKLHKISFIHKYSLTYERHISELMDCQWFVMKNEDGDEVWCTKASTGKSQSFIDYRLQALKDFIHKKDPSIDKEKIQQQIISFGKKYLCMPRKLGEIALEIKAGEISLSDNVPEEMRQAYKNKKSFIIPRKTDEGLERGCYITYLDKLVKQQWFILKDVDTGEVLFTETQVSDEKAKRWLDNRLQALKASVQIKMPSIGKEQISQIRSLEKKYLCMPRELGEIALGIKAGIRNFEISPSDNFSEEMQQAYKNKKSFIIPRETGEGLERSSYLDNLVKQQWFIVKDEKNNEMLCTEAQVPSNEKAKPWLDNRLRVLKASAQKKLPGIKKERLDQITRFGKKYLYMPRELGEIALGIKAGIRSFEISLSNDAPQEIRQSYPKKTNENIGRHHITRLDSLVNQQWFILKDEHGNEVMCIKAQVPLNEKVRLWLDNRVQALKISAQEKLPGIKKEQLDLIKSFGKKYLCMPRELGEVALLGLKKEIRSFTDSPSFTLSEEMQKINDNEKFKIYLSRMKSILPEITQLLIESKDAMEVEIEEPLKTTTVDAVLIESQSEFQDESVLGKKFDLSRSGCEEEISKYFGIDFKHGKQDAFKKLLLAPVARLSGEKESYGLYARAAFKKDEVIGTYEGERLSELKNKLSHYVHQIADGNGGYLFIDAAVQSNSGRFMNHSFSPNAEYRLKEREVGKGKNKTKEKYIEIVAIKPIMPGEQILASYGSEFLSKNITFLNKYDSDLSVEEFYQKRLTDYVKPNSKQLNILIDKDLLDPGLTAKQIRLPKVFSELLSSQANLAKYLKKTRQDVLDLPVILLDEQELALSHEYQPNLNALMAACKLGKKKEVEALLQAGAEPNFANTNGETALYYALQAKENKAELIQMLLTYGAEQALYDKEGLSPLHKCIELGDIASAKLIIDYHIKNNANYASKLSLTAESYTDPFMFALKHHQMEIFEYLLQSILAEEDKPHHIIDKLEWITTHGPSLVDTLKGLTLECWIEFVRLSIKYRLLQHENFADTLKDELGFYIRRREHREEKYEIYKLIDQVIDNTGENADYHGNPWNQEDEKLAQSSFVDDVKDANDLRIEQFAATSDASDVTLLVDHRDINKDKEDLNEVIDAMVVEEQTRSRSPGRTLFFAKTPVSDAALEYKDKSDINYPKGFPAPGWLAIT